jgi:hypothetical protein
MILLRLGRMIGLSGIPMRPCVIDIPSRVGPETRSATGAGPFGGPLPRNDTDYM